jgi:hypothetical protein
MLGHLGCGPVTFICPVPSIDRAAISTVESTTAFSRHREGMTLEAAFMILDSAAKVTVCPYDEMDRQRA